MKLSSVYPVAAVLGASTITMSSVVAQNEILSGSEVTIGERTFVAGLRATKSGSSFCGGSLIAPSYVLTAAHCAGDDVKWVSIGTHSLNGTSDGEQIKVTRQIPHPFFVSA